MFRFKEFAIEQSHSAMKVGTDGVLLGAWVGLEPQIERILDIGTGTGVIALMMAQRAPQAAITALDIDSESIKDARANVAASPWSSRVDIVECDVAEFFTDVKYDLIISNPPYFISSLHSPERARTLARHTESLPFDVLIASAERLLTEKGRFAVILPEDEGRRFKMMACERFSLRRVTEVWTTPRSGVKRLLMEFSREMCSDYTSDRLIISDGDFTAEYCALTKDFYLKF